MKQPIYKIKLRKNDLVEVIRGRLKGQRGRVLATYPRRNMVLLENLNIVKKHIKPNMQNSQGGIEEVVQPIAVGKVALIEPQSQKPTRIGWRLDKDNGKTRIYKRTQKAVATGSSKRGKG